MKYLHAVSDDNALAFVDDLLGRAAGQKSAMLRYGFSSSFQADWKAELGHVLHTAERLGYLDALWERVYSRLMGAGDEPEEIVPNDRRHHMLRADLAPATVVHCLVGTDWGFGGWEPERQETSGGGIDVDVALVAPDGTQVDVQVKAPDRPGHVSSRRRVGGESDEAVIAAMHHGALQLPRLGPQAKMLVVCAQRDRPLVFDAEAVVSHVLGGATQLSPTRFVLPRDRLGVFSKDWRHVGAVMLLDLIREPEVAEYGAIVLINPWAAVAVDPAWFAFGRLCTVEKDVVRWRGGHPRTAGLPEGTHLVDE